jgi:hypothetical protein
MAHPNEAFLERIIEILSKVKGESERRGYVMLSSIIEMARSEAGDALMTEQSSAALLSDFKGGTKRNGANSFGRVHAGMTPSGVMSRPNGNA